MIIVFGSINMDMFVSSDAMPQLGETVLVPAFDMSPGGKGANQALAALRSGAKVALVGRVGDDSTGMRIVTGLRRDGIMTSGVAHSDKSTGCALIMRDSSGQNRIIVASGANMDARAEQVPDEILKRGNVLLLQMEVPPEENWELLARARTLGATTILNLAPATKIPLTALSHVDILVVNQIEARQMADKMGIEVADNAPLIAQALSRQGKLTCIVTLGSRGAVAHSRDGHAITVPALQFGNAVVDTTGAGDAYCGTLAAAIHAGLELEPAMRRASVAGSLACLKHGAQSSFPWLGEIEESLKKLD